MFLRNESMTTLTDLREELEVDANPAWCAASEIRVDLTSDQVIQFPRTDGTNVEVPATMDGVQALGDYLQVPTAFLKRVDQDLREHILRQLLQRQNESVQLTYTPMGLLDMFPAQRDVIDPRELVDIASRTISPLAPVVEWWGPRHEFRFDTVAPVDFDRGVGGDPQVNDITQGGLRFGQDTKRGLVPWVQPYFYRLACTNGYETTDDGLKVDARGSTIDEVLAELEAAAERAFSRVEDEIAAFYDLRSQPVENPERMLIRLADEHSLPDRTLATLTRMAATEDVPDEPNMFDITNMVTNLANDPHIRNRTGARRTLEQVGGSVVSAHYERCGHCNARLVG